MPFSANDIRNGLSIADLDMVKKAEREIDFELVRRREELLQKGCIQISLGTKKEFREKRAVFERIKDSYIILGGWRHVFINEETNELVFVVIRE